MLLMVCIPFYTLPAFFAIYLINSQVRYLSSRKRRKEWLPKSAAKASAASEGDMMNRTGHTMALNTVAMAVPGQTH